MNTEQIADLLGISQKTVRDWTFKRAIPFYKVGRCVRFSQEEINKWLGERKKEPLN